MTERPEPPGLAARRAREAERLRENLRRRKAQARARRAAAPLSSAEDSGDRALPPERAEDPDDSDV